MIEGEIVRLLRKSRGGPVRWFTMDLDTFESFRDRGFALRGEDLYLRGHGPLVRSAIAHRAGGTGAVHVNGDRSDLRRENLRIVGTNVVIVSGDVGYLKVDSPKHGVRVFTFPADIADAVSGRHWVVARCWKTGKFSAMSRRLYIHWLVAGRPPPHMQTDHIDGDKQNNMRENLRLVTATENQQNRVRPNKNNRSGRKGVYPYGKNRWRASATLNGVQIHLGGFATAEEAQRVADAFRAKHCPGSPEARSGAGC